MKRKFKGGVYGFFERRVRRNPSRMNKNHVLGKLDTKRYIAMMQRSDNKYHHNFSNPTVLFKTGNAQWLMDRNTSRLMDFFLTAKTGIGDILVSSERVKDLFENAYPASNG